MEERLGVKKSISYGPVRKRRGGGKPPGRNQNRVFSEKEKKMQNILKWKICKNIL